MELLIEETDHSLSIRILELGPKSFVRSTSASPIIGEAKLCIKLSPISVHCPSVSWTDGVCSCDNLLACSSGSTAKFTSSSLCSSSLSFCLRLKTLAVSPMAERTDNSNLALGCPHESIMCSSSSLVLPHRHAGFPALAWTYSTSIKLPPLLYVVVG